MKPFEYYINVTSASYPNKKKIKDEIFVGFEEYVGTVAELKKRKEYLESLVTKEYKKQLASYNKELAKLEEEFKRDAFEELDISDNPKKDKLYSVAYQKGHSYGYGQIFTEMCDMVELIQD